MSSGKFAGEIAFTNCTVTVKTVKMNRMYLNRVRAWDATGVPLIAMRVWAEVPFERGMLMQMQPIVAPKTNISLAAALAALEEEIEANEGASEATEAAGAPARGNAGTEGGAA